MLSYLEKVRVSSLSSGLLVVLTCFCSQGPAAAETSVSGHVSIATDHIFRGVSQTMSGAAVEVEVDVEFENGWYGYVWASNVDFTDSLDPDDGANFEIDFGIGYEFAVNNNVTLGVEAVTYTFPGTKEGYSYDYEEIIASVSIFEQHSLTLGYTDNLFGNSADARFYAVKSGTDLSDGIGLSLELGHYDFSESFGDAYSYMTLSIAGELRSVEWQLAYITTTAADQDLFYASNTADRVMLALRMSF